MVGKKRRAQSGGETWIFPNSGVRFGGSGHFSPAELLPQNLGEDLRPVSGGGQRANPPAKGFGGKDSVKGNRQGSLSR